MAQRRHHYEQAFETYLRDNRIPYIAVDEAKKALIPQGEKLRLVPAPGSPPHAIKSFDFVVYADPVNLLIDVKGRKVIRPRSAKPDSKGRLESWVTQDDVDSLKTWQRIFGDQFRAAFVFCYWCEHQPRDALFQEIFEHRGRWYALRAVLVDTYAHFMRQRSPRWGTVHVPAADFEQISRPFCGRVPADLAEPAPTLHV